MDCLLMGPDPSFIVTFYQTAPQLIAREALTATDLNNIKIPGARFTHGNRMLSGDYIVHAEFEKPQHTCYSKKTLLTFVTKMRQSPLISAVTPNFLSSVTDTLQNGVLDANQTEPRPLGSGTFARPFGRGSIVNSAQWNLKQPPGGIDVENVWADFTFGNPNITVAVLDTGILNHDALTPNILPGFYFTNAGQSGAGASPSCLNCAGFNHGTIVAGIIASTGTAVYGEGIFGVAPYTTILPINVFTEFTDEKTCGFPPCLYSYLSDQLNALHWLTNTDLPNVVAVNMSLGNLTACPKPAQDAFESLENGHISAVVAAGNHNTDASRDYPANCHHVISVAATGLHGERAAYSNWGASITIAAPGGNADNSIKSTTENGYIQRQGTSLAAPHVSAVIALLYAIDPTLDPIKVNEILTSSDSLTSFPLSNEIPKDQNSCVDIQFPEKSCGAGILNAYKAAKKLFFLRKK